MLHGHVTGTIPWSNTTTKILLDFYKKYRCLWDKNHKDYGKKTYNGRSWLHCWWCCKKSNHHTLRIRWKNAKKDGPESEIKWHFRTNMSFLQESIKEEEKGWSEQDIGQLNRFWHVILFELVIFYILSLIEEGDEPYRTLIPTSFNPVERYSPSPSHSSSGTSYSNNYQMQPVNYQHDYYYDEFSWTTLRMFK